MSATLISREPQLVRSATVARLTLPHVEPRDIASAVLQAQEVAARLRRADTASTDRLAASARAVAEAAGGLSRAVYFAGQGAGVTDPLGLLLVAMPALLAGLRGIAGELAEPSPEAVEELVRATEC